MSANHAEVGSIPTRDSTWRHHWTGVRVPLALPFQTEENAMWRLICKTCAYKFPVETAINISKADCCIRPSLFIKSLSQNAKSGAPALSRQS